MLDPTRRPLLHRFPAARLSALLAASLATACAPLGDFTPDDPGLREAPGRFEGSFLALSDSDMAATAYADGGLEPLPGVRDALTLFEDGGPVARADASNSVISWPQVVDVSIDGRFAYVVETRAPAPRDAAQMTDVFTDFPPGSRLAVFGIEADRLDPVDAAPVGLNPQSVEATGAGDLVIGSEAEGAELVTVQLDPSGRIQGIRTFALHPPYRESDEERRIRTVHVAPDGVTLAVNVANRRIQFYRLTRDVEGVPTGVTPVGRPSRDRGRRLAVGKWMPGGRHFVVTDTNWGEGAISMLIQGPGSLFALVPPTRADEAPRVVSRVEVGRSPEGFGVSADGRLLATINMERTYLPERALLGAWAGRRRYSVSLIRRDPVSGRLVELDRAYQAGILPEDVIFDRSGRNLAVAVFHRRRGPDRARGFVDFFSIDGEGRLASQGVAASVTRGVHDLVSLP